MRIIILLAILGLLPFGGKSQAIVTYGKYSVDSKEFLRAFNKNNTQPAASRSQAIREYLELYINSRLKIREAYDRGFDTLPHVVAEVANLRNQIAQNYINDPTVSNRLQQEAFQRSQKDIHIAHIFISFRNSMGIIDTIAAGQERDEVMSKLNKGEDFAKLAKAFSDDTTARVTGGDLGWITVFTLPYTMENIVYSLSPGKFSQPFRSGSGYHIVKNIAERQAAGKLKAQQILIALPPGASEADKKRTGVLADSLYKSIQKGSRFETLATSFSNDYISAATGGNIPDIAVGQYDPVFEKMVWSLPKDSSITKPFLTSHGWHIVRRLAIKPVVKDSTNPGNRQELLSQIMADSRWKASKDFIYNKVAGQGRLTLYNYADPDLFLFTDSMLHMNTASVNGRISITTPLVKLGNTDYPANDWVKYAQANRYSQDGTSRPYSLVKNDWIQQLVDQYYVANLEEYNDEFRFQMTEFKDGNLFFEIMQQEIWNKAQNDTAALASLFEKNKVTYNFEKAVDAVLFFCSDAPTAKEIQAAIKKNPTNWKKITEQFAEKVVADSSRFESSQLPLAAGAMPVEGLVTAPLLNINDNSASFSYIIKVYTTPLPRSFVEAKGLVINDYQLILEKAWIETLRKKYPVVINQKVLADISR